VAQKRQEAVLDNGWQQPHNRPASQQISTDAHDLQQFVQFDVV